jgi:hypothetical protein
LDIAGKGKETGFEKGLPNGIISFSEFVNLRNDGGRYTPVIRF